MSGLEGVAFPLSHLEGHWVTVITTDGRVFIGILKAQDTTTNIVLAQALERIYCGHEEAVREDVLGVFMIRGDTVAVVGLLDRELDLQVSGKNKHVRAAPLNPIVH